MNMNHALTGPQMLIGSLPTLLPFETLHKLLQLEKALDLLIQLRIRPLFFLSKFLQLNVICLHLLHLLRQLLRLFRQLIYDSLERGIFPLLRECQLPAGRGRSVS